MAEGGGGPRSDDDECKREIAWKRGREKGEGSSALECRSKKGSGPGGLGPAAEKGAGRRGQAGRRWPSGGRVGEAAPEMMTTSATVGVGSEKEESKRRLCKAGSRI